jgi:TM2 domain-containing membrane protein YozV
MKRNPLIAGLLSLLVPGLGQIYGERGVRGAAILVSAIIIGNLNLLFVLAFAIAEPDPSAAWAYWLPRLGRDVMSIWSVVFWIWVVVDAYRQVKQQTI